MSNSHEQSTGSESPTIIRLCNASDPKPPHTRNAATIWKERVIITTLFELLAQLPKVGIGFELTLLTDQPDVPEGAD